MRHLGISTPTDLEVLWHTLLADHYRTERGAISLSDYSAQQSQRSH